MAAVYSINNGQIRGASIYGSDTSDKSTVGTKDVHRRLGWMFRIEDK